MPELKIPEIREIAPPLPPDSSWPFYLWIALGVAVVMAIALVIILIRGRSKPPVVTQSEYDARQSALDKLHQLKETYLEHPATEFGLRASHGLREYLTSHYGSMTPFETGKEFLARQDDHGLMSETKYVVVRELYERAENLKYAPAPGADSLRLDLVEDIITFVRDDVPGPQLTPAQASDADPLPA